MILPPLPQTAVCCYATSNAAIAFEIATYLETNYAVTVDLQGGLVRPGFDLLDAAAHAVSADIALVLLSPDSVPPTWERERWEPVLLNDPGIFGTRVAFLLLGECKFPALFRRKDFFDFTGDIVSAQRRLKRWLFDHEISRPHSNFPELERALADRPGLIADMPSDEAHAFAGCHAEDFESVITLSCSHRSRAGITGDFAEALGLKLQGPVEKNLAALKEVCSLRRLLILFDHLAQEDREFIASGGRASMIFTSSAEAPAVQPFDQILALFAAWTRNENECLHHLGDAQWHLCEQTPLRERMQLGFAVTAFLRHRERLAEVFEIAGLMAQWLRNCGDILGSQRIEWEQSWILEQWGGSAARAPHLPEDEPEQLALFY